MSQSLTPLDVQKGLRTTLLKVLTQCSQVEAYSNYAASALASNSFARASIAAAFPLIQLPMYDKLGYHWGTSVLAFMTVAMMPFPWLFFKYGKILRRKSRFAS
ncbi:Uncharacterized protein HZ326_1205 [Fusarium oxysporum f. sp. albedinis]|nr:Uncharacterized protein HZ326_1205 [Fusarium oxysporum f. sp. albedinis]